MKVFLESLFFCRNGGNVGWRHIHFSPQRFENHSLCGCYLNTGQLTLSQRQIVDSSKRKFLNLMKMGEHSPKWVVEKHCGKKGNCSLRAISPFLTVFSRLEHMKTRTLVGKDTSRKFRLKNFTFFFPSVFTRHCIQI